MALDGWGCSDSSSRSLYINGPLAGSKETVLGDEAQGLVSVRHCAMVGGRPWRCCDGKQLTAWPSHRTIGTPVWLRWGFRSNCRRDCVPAGGRGLLRAESNDVRCGHARVSLEMGSARTRVPVQCSKEESHRRILRTGFCPMG